MKKNVASLLLLGFILFGCSNPVNVGIDLTPGIYNKNTFTSGELTPYENEIPHIQLTRVRAEEFREGSG